MFLRPSRLTVAAFLFATCVVASFGGCGLSTHGTGTNSEPRCTATSQCNDNEPCTADECTADGVCTHTAEPDGDGPPSTQSPGSCQKTVCKAGVLTTVDDDLNVSDDGEQCTLDECKDGKPVHPGKPDATECKVGKATGKCAAGTCKVECGFGLPACDDGSACTSDTCDPANGKCVFSPLDGVMIPGVVDKPGDCVTPRCVGGKAVEGAFDDTDLPATTSDCVTPTCMAGTPSLPPLTTGSVCSTTGGTVCDGVGACVECNAEADCKNLPVSDECQTRVCAAHKCGTAFAAANKPLVSQKPGDCQVLVCDGKGNKISANDDKDIPSDGNDCLKHICAGGVADNGELPADTKCGLGLAFVCDGKGSCVGCNAPTDCSGTDDDCKTKTCVAKKCGFDYQPDGTALPDPKQKKADCQRLECDGSGNIKSSAFDTDLPIDGNDCTKDACASGIVSNPPLVADTPCAKGFCDNAANCVQCNNASQCPNPPICVTATCNAHACGTSSIANGTLAPPSQQKPADCKDAICDGNGGVTTQANTNDLPDDGNQCTSDTCTGSTPTFAAKPAHTPCSQNGGKVCDGNQTCQGCVDSGDCTAPSTCGGGNPGKPNICGCTKKTCAQLGQTCGTPPDGCNAGGTLVCNDSKFNGSETDVDCGGDGSTCNIKCGQGKACNVASDCSSGNCVDGVCCNAACTGSACYGCSLALNGVGDGQCLPVKANVVDPRGLCRANDVCAAGGKCQCADIAKDGSETDVDCGGNACLTCAQAKTCKVAGDCFSGFCADGFCCDKACGGACQACSKILNGVANGTCGNIAAGAAPDPNPGHAACVNAGDVCGTGGLCRCADASQDGAEVDVDCGGPICGKCSGAKKCAVPGDCASGFCTDGLCCNKACNGLCEACTKALTGGADGTCAPTPANQDPASDCAMDAASTCQKTGMCDGAGACAKYDNATVCLAASCDPGTETQTAVSKCDGAGTCVTGAKAACSPYICGANACASTCANDAGCIAADYCDLVANPKVCKPKGAQGGACTGNNQCSNGICVDNFCCSALCSGVCQACSNALTGAANGTCAPIPVNTDPSDECATSAASTCGQTGMCNGANACAKYDNATVCLAASCAAGTQKADSKCDGAGVCVAGAQTPCTPYVCGANACKSTCVGDGDCIGGDFCDLVANPKVCKPKLAQGAACTGANQCVNGLCVDGFCCNAACGGACQACSNALTGGANGTCASIAAGTDPSSECTQDAASTCGQTGMCDGAGACAKYGNATVCLAASCSAGTEKADSMCNGLGTCIGGAQTACTPYVCSGNACATTCADDAGCIAADYCSLAADPKVCTPKVADGGACAGNNQCANNVCKGNVCYPASCGNGSVNAPETDIDCGGGTCPKCANSKVCAVNADCTSDNCLGLVCLTPTCVDGVKNGLETDVDCGGASCGATCLAGNTCASGADCLSGVCTGNACVGP